MHPLLMRLLGRKPNTLPPFNHARNRYKTKKKWPPDMLALPPRQQFLYERRFKRRMLLKSIRPTWNKWTKIVQWTIIGSFSVYVLWFMDFKDPRHQEEHPMQPLRDWTNDFLRGLFGGEASEEEKERRRRRAEEPELIWAPGYGNGAIKKDKKTEAGEGQRAGPT